MINKLFNRKGNPTAKPNIAATIEMLFATSSFFLRFQILFTVRYPLIKEKIRAPETRTPINFSNKDISVLFEASEMERKHVHIRMIL